MVVCELQMDTEFTSNGVAVIELADRFLCFTLDRMNLQRNIADNILFTSRSASVASTRMYVSLLRITMFSYLSGPLLVSAVRTAFCLLRELIQIEFYRSLRSSGGR